jgi:hypothetical protein
LRSEGLERVKIMIYTPRPRHKSSSAANLTPRPAITSFRRGHRGGGFYNSASKMARGCPIISSESPLFYAPRRSALRQTPGILGKRRNGAAAEMKNRAAI